MEFEDITLGEIAEIEDYAGMSFSKVGDDIPGVFRLRIGLAWVLKRRIDPSFTIEQAAKITPNELGELFGEVDSEVKK